MSQEKELIKDIQELKKGNYLNVLNGSSLKSYIDASDDNNWEKIKNVSH